jgi:hypothetical protein
MALNIAKEVRAMEKCTVRELRKQYADVFGEATNASNKNWLIKRIAWRMQSNVEGDISKRARNRALEIANDADLRMSPPPDAPKPKAQPQRTVTSKVSIEHDDRLPPPGSQLKRTYKGQLYICTVREDGFEYEGEFFKSLTAVAKAITGQHCSGYAFFKLGKAAS